MTEATFVHPYLCLNQRPKFPEEHLNSWMGPWDQFLEVELSCVSHLFVCRILLALDVALFLFDVSPQFVDLPHLRLDHPHSKFESIKNTSKSVTFLIKNLNRVGKKLKMPKTSVHNLQKNGSKS